MERQRSLNLVIVSTVVLLVVCGPASAVDVNGLVAYWSLDEGSGTIAYDSAGDNDGVLNGSAAWTSGQIGGALGFDGSGDYVQVPHDDSLTLISAGTVAAWVNLNDSYRQAIVAKQPSTSSGNYFLFTSTGRHMGFGISNGNWTKKVWVYTPGDAITNEWAFYVGTFDGDTVNLYENGVLVNSLPNTITPIATSQPLYIGRWQNNSDWDCDGSIDEVMIFNRALSAAEVEQLYWEVFSDLEIAIMQVEEALAEKEAALEGIDIALEKELVAYDALEEALESKDYGDLKKSDIIKARQRIHSAIQHQAQSAGALERGVEQLGDALEALGVEPEPNEP
ncbi:MAG: LamG domain-containing protein [Planctomycetota bacterium]|nr:MAG: LamG domain-containing protein [Planctomycetota bacterium]